MPRYELGFRHTPATGTKLRETHVYIHCDGELIAQGCAVCAPTDNFNKGTGRKTALNNAFIKYPLTRAQRAQIWDDYLANWGYRGVSSFGRKR